MNHEFDYGFYDGARDAVRWAVALVLLASVVVLIGWVLL